MPWSFMAIKTSRYSLTASVGSGVALAEVTGGASGNFGEWSAMNALDGIVQLSVVALRLVIRVLTRSRKRAEYAVLSPTRATLNNAALERRIFIASLGKSCPPLRNRFTRTHPLHWP